MSRKPKPRLLITRLLAEGMTHAKVAEIIDCSTKTVSRVEKELKKEAASLDVMEEYRSLLEEKIPLAARVAVYAELAKQDSHLPTKLKSLERIDDLLGVVTAKDNLRAINTGQGPPIGPMFVFADGVRPRVSASCLTDPPIDLTPEELEKYRGNRSPEMGNGKRMERRSRKVARNTSEH